MIPKNITFILCFLIILRINAQQKNYDNKYLSFADSTLTVLQNNWCTHDWNCSDSTTNPWQMKNIWNAYNTAEALIDYINTSGNKDFLPLIENFMDNECAFLDSKYAGYDDAQWTAITLIKTFQLTQNKKYLDKAVELWNYIVENSWDEKFCGGGLWWNVERTYKNAITNELFLMLSTMLYLETGETLYKNWALKVWKWFTESGMISEKTGGRKIKNLINDGLNRSCKNNEGEIWTYNQAVILGGLTNLWKITSDSSYIIKAVEIAETAIQNLSENNILKERTDLSLNTDQQQFKGIFIRYLAYLTINLPDKLQNEKEYFKNFVFYNADFVWRYNKQGEINTYWSEKSQEKHNFLCTPISQTSGLDLFNAAILLYQK